MATKTLLSQTGAVGAGGIVFFSETDNIRTIQINPNANAGFSGSLLIEGTYAASPGARDFVTIAEITFTGHTQNMTIDIHNSSPNIRANIVTSNQGEIAVYGDSRSGITLIGGNGSGPATAVISSSSNTAVTGNNVRIDAPVVPSITSDDVIYANDFAYTVTDKLDGKQDKLSGSGVVSPNLTTEDMNILAGSDAYGLTIADMEKLADIQASSSEINMTIGATGNFQAQLDALDTGYVIGAGVDLSGLTVSAAQLNSFFSMTITASADEINKLAGLTAATSDLNGLTGTGGTYVAADLVKLGEVNTTSAELNKLGGFVGTSADLNKLVGLTAATADLNATTGLAISGVSVDEMKHLAGLTVNVQNALDTIPNMVGLTSSVSDLNLLMGAATGTGAYIGAIQAIDIATLDGISAGGNIQAQLDTKRNTFDTVGIQEITGSAISTIELNYLESARANIQVQLDSLSAGAISPDGGEFTGPVCFYSGGPTSPSVGLKQVGSCNTGFYLHGVSGIGFAESGEIAASMEGGYFELGGGDFVESPILHNYVGDGLIAPNSIVNPAYTFSGDRSSGMYSLRNGTGQVIGLTSAGRSVLEVDGDANTINIGGDTSNNFAVEISGVYSGEKMLGKVLVDANAVGQTTVYTVPAARTTVITKVIVRLVSGGTGSSGSTFRMNLGTGANQTDLVDHDLNDWIYASSGGSGPKLFDTPGQVVVLGIGSNEFTAISGNDGNSYGIWSAGSSLIANIASGGVAGAPLELELIVFGYEYMGA